MRRLSVQAIIGKVSMRLFLAFMVGVWLIPPLGLLVSSIRSEQDIAGSGWWTAIVSRQESDSEGSDLPLQFLRSNWTLENYQNVLFADDMLSAFINSLLLTIPSTVIPITTAAFAAYGLSWIKFKGREAAYLTVLILLVVPLQMALIPILKIYTTLDLNGTFVGVWLAHTGFGLPLAIYLLHNYISSLPRSIIESAHIDGAAHYTIFTRLIFPLTLPVLASFAIFQFLWVWNDLLVALVFLGTGAKISIVTTRLAELVGSRGQDWHVLTAGAFITMIMPLIVFFALQRYFVHGLLSGSVKE